jgi:predicted dehydrogenase
VRIAIVGVGWAGRRHAEAIRELAEHPGAEVHLTCLVDNDADFLAQQAAELGVSKTYQTLAAALADPVIDAVSICTPHHLHREHAVAAARAKKHVLVEKPMALRVEEATEMIDAADANGVRLYVAESRTYAPQTRFLREAVRTGRPIGEVTCAAFAEGFRAPDFGYAGRRTWLTRPELGGTGTWMLHGIHSMAALRHIFGEVAAVFLHEHHAASFRRPDIEGTVSGLLALESGVPVTVTQTCESRLWGTLGGFVVHGDRGSIRATDQGYQVFEADAPRGAAAPSPQPYPEAALSPYAQEIADFAAYAAGVSEGPTTGRSERRSLAIVQAGYESARTGQPVVLRERFGDL